MPVRIRSRTPSRASLWCGSLWVASLLAACTRDAPPIAWISDRSAVVRCTSSGPRPPAPIVAGLPVPQVPTGLLARQLDPLALDDLGYARDAMVCATLEVPLRSSLDLAAGLERLLELHVAADRAAERILGRCVCEAARRQGVRDLVGDCPQVAARTGCTDASRDEEVVAAIAPLIDALDDVTLPWVHWRLVGATDRPGWFAEHLTTLIANHEGGAVVMIRGQPLPSREDPVARALLEHEHVVAVVRQDGGQALLVAREMDGWLVLDHFRRPATTPQRVALVGEIEAAQTATLIAMLAPGQPRPTVAEIGAGTSIELDRPLLEDFDRQVTASGPLSDTSTDAPVAGPPALFDRVVFMAPHGASGEALRIEHVLSLDGLAWAQTLTDEPLVGSADALGLSPATALPAVDADDPRPFVLRDRDTARWGLHGIHHAGELLRELEIAVPGAVSGDRSSWQLQWPGTPLPGALAASGGGPYAALRKLVSNKPYRLDAKFDTARTKLTIELRPQ